MDHEQTPLPPEQTKSLSKRKILLCVCTVIIWAGISVLIGFLRNTYALGTVLCFCISAVGAFSMARNFQGKMLTEHPEKTVRIILFIAFLWIGFWASDFISRAILDLRLQSIL